jgi:DNA-binding transcriptional ArsR family regulator
LIELRMGERDVLRMRFAISPVWEALAAVRAVSRAQVPPSLRPWRDPVAPVDPELLTRLQFHSSYTPDFLTPPPAAGERSIEAEIALVAATPLQVVREEVTRCLHEGDLRDPLLQEMARRPAAARTRIVRELEIAWDAYLKPTWPRLHRVLATDVDHRSRRLVSGGIAALLEDLDPTVEWEDGTLRVRGPVNDRRDLKGEGVVLMPSLFTVSRPLVILDPPYQPTLIYQARGIGTAFTKAVAPAEALVRLLGQGRADLLALLDEPSGTGSLAIVLDRSAGTVSEHLHALRSAGLAEVRRTGKRSRWSRTPLGDALVAGPLTP